MSDNELAKVIDFRKATKGKKAPVIEPPARGADVTNISNPETRENLLFYIDASKRERTPGTPEHSAAIYRNALQQQQLSRLKSQKDIFKTFYGKDTTNLSPQMGQVINVDFVNKKRI